MVSKVSDLLLPDRKEWNEHLVRELFSELDADDILHIKILRWDGNDFLAWNWTTNGLFTVRSAYKLRRQEDFIINRDKKGGSSSSVQVHNGWLKLWSAKVPGKVKIHLWRICLQSIAVGDELKRRKIKDLVSCPYCFRGEVFITAFGVVVMSKRSGRS